MTDTHTYERPYRAWGVRLYNALGGVLSRAGIPLGSLEEEQLLEKARRMTGLSDFGDDSFRAPLGVLLRAYEEESELTPFGRLLVRVSTLNLLCNRLRVQQMLSEHPEILELPIRRPLFIVALPRTGTTLLYNLLAQDPGARPLMMWEAILPVPRSQRPGRQTDSRILRAVLVGKALNRLAPNLSTVHPVTPKGPEECSRLQMNTFVTAYATMEHFVPSYQRWFLQQPDEVLERAYGDYRHQLQVLQWQRPGSGHWVLKSPAHVLATKALLGVFPDACVVQLHRDPHKVIPSLCSLYAIYQGIASDQVRCRQLGAQVLELCMEGHRRSYQVRQSSLPGQILDVHYQDLMADPIAATRRIYSHFDYAWSDAFGQRAEAWLRDHPKDRHGKHRYDLDQFGLSRELIDRSFQDYCQHYGIEPEGRRPDGASHGSMALKPVSQ